LLREFDRKLNRLTLQRRPSACDLVADVSLGVLGDALGFRTCALEQRNFVVGGRCVGICRNLCERRFQFGEAPGDLLLTRFRRVQKGLPILEFCSNRLRALGQVVREWLTNRVGQEDNQEEKVEGVLQDAFELEHVFGAAGRNLFLAVESLFAIPVAPVGDAVVVDVGEIVGRYNMLVSFSTACSECWAREGEGQRSHGERQHQTKSGHVLGQHVNL
jgi:hypothetical protein